MGPNYGGENYISHCWDYGSSTVTNNNGTITSQVRARKHWIQHRILHGLEHLVDVEWIGKSP